jgi:hypothetical protein
MSRLEIGAVASATALCRIAPLGAALLDAARLRVAWLRAMLAAVVLTLGVEATSATPPAPPPPVGPLPPDILARLEAERLLLFGGTDLWRAGGFLHGGFAWAPEGLDRNGPLLRLLVGTGVYQYRSGRRLVVAGQVLGALTSGWVFRRGAFTAVVHGGLDVQDHATQPLDPGNPLRGLHIGLRFGVETWWEPAPDIMVAVAATWSSIGQGFGLQAAAGWRVLEPVYGGFYVGPEVQTYGDETYRQLRAGLHLTAWKLGPYQWSGGVGWTMDTDDRSGPYVRFGVLTKL